MWVLIAEQRDRAEREKRALQRRLDQIHNIARAALSDGGAHKRLLTVVMDIDRVATQEPGA